MFSRKYIPVFSQGISLWAVCVLPATFPFLFLTSLLTELGFCDKFSKWLSPLVRKVFRLPALSGYVLSMSLLSGYPVGAKLLCDLTEHGFVTREQASDMTVVCSSSGPLFLLGSVGNVMFSSLRAGFLLFLSHLLAILLTAFLFRKRTYSEAKPLSGGKKDPDSLLYSCMLSSVLSILCVGGFIAVFYLLSQMFCDLIRPLAAVKEFPLLLPVLSGLIEMTGGCKLLAATSSFFALPLCALLVTLGGVGILVQQIAYLKKAGIPVRRFLLSKAVSSVLAFCFCILFCLFL